MFSRGEYNTHTETESSRCCLSSCSNFSGISKYLGISHPHSSPPFELPSQEFHHRLSFHGNSCQNSFGPVDFSSHVSLCFTTFPSHPIPSLLHLLEERLSRFFSDFQSRILSNLSGLGPQDRRGPMRTGWEVRERGTMCLWRFWGGVDVEM